MTLWPVADISILMCGHNDALEGTNGLFVRQRGGKK